MASNPLYRQIQEDIKAQIAPGLLRAGDHISSESGIMNHCNALIRQTGS